VPDKMSHVRLGSIQREATVTKSLDDYQATHRDYFDRESGPTVGVDFYGEENKASPAEKPLKYDELLEARQQQVALVSRLRGVGVAPTAPNAGGKTGDAEASSAQLVAQIGRKIGVEGKDLHSEADWRMFMRDLYRAVNKIKNSPEDSLRFVVKLLEEYFTAFAMSSPFNILDKPPSYIDMKFPRAASGQLLHDCGVFALKIAYILSLLVTEESLKLRLEFVVLPGHISLVMRGPDLPVFVFQNNQVLIYEQSDWEKMVAISKGAGRTQEEAEGEMAGTLAAQSFIPGVDMPYRRIELATAGDAKKSMTTAFDKRGDVFDTSDPARAQAEMVEYLAVATQDAKTLKDVHTKTINDKIAKVWNPIKGQLAAHLSTMIKEPSTSKKYTAAQDGYWALSKRYQEAIESIVTDMQAKFGWRDGKKILTAENQTVGREREMEVFNAKTGSHHLAPGATRSSSKLLPGGIAEPWQLDHLTVGITQHVTHVNTINGMEANDIRALSVTKFFAVSPFLAGHDGAE
jgi:hypothetical protein